EQRLVEAAALVHQRINAVQLDAAHRHRVELDEIDRRRAVGRARSAAPPAAIVDAQALGILARQRYQRGAGIDDKAHRHAVDRAVDEEVAARIGRERRLGAAAGGAAAAVILAAFEHALLAVHFDGGAILLHRKHGDAAPALPDLDGLRLAAVEREHRGLVADYANKRQLRRAGRGAGEEERKANK